MEESGRGKYWRKVYKRSFSKAQKLFGARGEVVRLTIGIVFTVLTLAGSAYFGFIARWSHSSDIIKALFLGDAIVIVSLFVFAPLVAVFMMPGTVSEINREQEEVIKTLSVKEPPEIEKLGKLRTKGVALKHTGKKIKDEATLDGWIEEVQKWEWSVRRQIKILSPGEAEFFHTLDEWSRPRGKYSYAIDKKHKKFLSIHDERLKRLAEIIKRFLPN